MVNLYGNRQRTEVSLFFFMCINIKYINLIPNFISLTNQINFTLNVRLLYRSIILINIINNPIIFFYKFKC